ncbi:hypothetical protein ANN_25278 [Periplaneta americana]|uniref:DUF4817 domain-containing protein n=1 Tax=Periplaneta americana TaxID=6978 RepID=A0ABQ8S150_PERAM|nr:hypothetical protein ANN_25278 [Periplaneta americana]
MCPEMLGFRVMTFKTVIFTGTFFFPQTKDTLSVVFAVVLCDMYSNQVAEVHFMYGKADGNAALAHRSYQEKYPDRRIGRGGRIVWPPRSPDLSPIDFYLWGYLKSLVYSSPVPNMESLRNRIVADCEEIRNTPGIWDRVRRAMRHRYEACIQAGEFNEDSIVGATDNKKTANHNTLLPSSVVVITEDVQNVHLLLEYRPHIDVSLTCEYDPKLQEYCVCPQNMPQFDSEGIPNQAPETNKPMILNGPTCRNREGSDQETFDPSTGEPYD